MTTWTVDGNLTTETIDGVANVVTEVPWQLSLTVGDVTAVCKGRQKLNYDSGSPFIQYSDLTQATVIGWVKNAMTADGVSFYETACTHHATRQNNSPNYSNTTTEVFAEYIPPESDQPVPWAP